jgi:nicotinamide/nicotinate riboside kinase
VRDEVEKRWRGAFEGLGREMGVDGEKIVWGLVDGFLLYWNEVSLVWDCEWVLLIWVDQDVIAQLDVRIFLRVPHDVLRKRRHERHGYHTAGKEVDVYPRMTEI